MSISKSPRSPVPTLHELRDYPNALELSQVAQLFSVSEKTVYRQAKEGLIPSFRIGTNVRFNPRLLAEWMESQ